MYEEIIRRHRPRGWRIRYTKTKDRVAEETRRECAAGKLPAHKQDLASVHNENRVIYAPRPVDVLTLQVLLHEFAHVHLEHFTRGHSMLSREEFEAERWSMEIMRMEGIRVPKWVRDRGRRYVAWCVQRDEHDGKEVEPHVRRFGLFP